MLAPWSRRTWVSCALSWRSPSPRRLITSTQGTKNSPPGYSRRRLARDAYENLRFRLRGSTDDRADDVRRRVGEMIAGVPVRELQRLSPRVLAGVLPRLYPEMLARAYAHQDAGTPV